MSVDAIQEIERSEATKADMLLGQIEELDKSLTEYFPNTLVVDNALTRKLVSFQANKCCFGHVTKWCKETVGNNDRCSLRAPYGVSVVVARFIGRWDGCAAAINRRATRC